MSSSHLIVGLGNPGGAYTHTRHNLGYEVVKAFAAKQGWSFKKEARLLGWVARGSFENKNVVLLLPATYMNLSGDAVRKAIRDTGVALLNKGLLIVADDIYLKFGHMRLKMQGSHGGHNGLRSIEHSLGTRDYPRLRIGIEQEKEGQLREEYVLERWSVPEETALPQVLRNAAEVIECLLTSGIEAAQQKIGLLNKNHEEA